MYVMTSHKILLIQAKCVETNERDSAQKKICEKHGKVNNHIQKM